MTYFNLSLNCPIVPSMDALQVVAEPRKRRILQLVWSEELPAGDIADQFDVSFAAVSQHLATLREHGFVSMRADGNRRLYKANRKGLGELAPILEAMWGEKLDRLVEIIEDEA